MKKSTVILSVVSGVVLLGFLIIVYSLTNKPVNTNAQQVNKLSSTDHVKWSKDKKNILIEYGDFQCPACSEFHKVMSSYEASGSANADIPKKVTFVFRHYPLFQIHANAYISSYAVEAAAKQNKFWEMYDLVYQSQAEWSSLPDPTDYFFDLASKLELNTDKFMADINSQEVKDKVAADLRSGNSAQINSTPSFIYNGKKLDFQSFDEFAQILRSGTK